MLILYISNEINYLMIFIEVKVRGYRVSVYYFRNLF